LIIYSPILFKISSAIFLSASFTANAAIFFSNSFCFDSSFARLVIA